MKIIADTLVAEMSKDELIDLVIAIDDQVGEWVFTEQLAQHFAVLQAAHDNEQKLDVKNSERRPIDSGVPVSFE